MKLLNPVPLEDVPERAHGSRVYDPIYEKVLSLNGLALPVEFETKGDAELFTKVARQPKGQARKLGLRASMRGKTVFVYKEKRPR